MKDPYYVLGVSKNATTDEIKRAFRRLAKETHPDTNGGRADSIERFHEISNAYTILIDPEKRRLYDKDSNGYTQEKNQNNNFWSDREDFLNKEIMRAYILAMLDQLSHYKKEALKATMVGFAWLLGGIVISLSSYQSALNRGGGQYFVTTGAILFGAIQAIKGMMVSSKINGAINDLEKELWDEFDDKFYSRNNTKTTYTGYREPKTDADYEASHNFDAKQEDKHQEHETNKDIGNFKQDTSFSTNDKASGEGDDNANGENKEAKIQEKSSLAVVFTIIVLIGMGIYGLTQPINTSNSNSQNSNTVQETSTNQEAITKDNEFLTNIQRRSLIRTIDYERAEKFLKTTYENRGMEKLLQLFRNLGYSCEGFSHNNPKELILSIAHFQKKCNLEVDGMAGPNTMKTVATKITEILIGEIVYGSLDADSNVKKRYGWDAKKVDTFTYFVVYEFDYDENRNNGITFYAFETDLTKQTSVEITGDLETKYKKLGFLN
jgi:curved DNA-binding protein CbpA